MSPFGEEPQTKDTERFVSASFGLPPRGPLFSSDSTVLGLF